MGRIGLLFDVILFRYAEALLINAEAKAELGTISQSDLDLTVNKLRSRAGMPMLSLAEANANPDPYLLAMYPNVDAGAFREFFWKYGAKDGSNCSTKDSAGMT